MRIRLTATASPEDKKDTLETGNQSKKDAKKDSPVLEKSKVGMINNLMSTDLEQLTDAR